MAAVEHGEAQPAPPSEALPRPTKVFVLLPASSLWARSPIVKPTWEPAEGEAGDMQPQGPASCDAHQSQGRGEMGLRANRPMTSLRTGKPACPKNKGP